ncbi:MAG: nucleotidyltransferase family protein [Alcaligenaceae bacterium]|nr:nucleotidyltransferase family protein [Alcaligenaceae bacterium]
MRAMILAAGRGERMRPLTDTCPKPLLTVGGTPLIIWHIRRLARSGIRDIIINHAWLGDQIEAALGDGQSHGVRLTYSPEPTALETAGGIAQALEFFRGEPFLVINGDIWCDWDPAQAPTIADGLHTRQDLAWLLLVDNPGHHPNGDFRLRPDARLGLVDGPALTFSGIGIYRPELFSAVIPGTPAKLAPILRSVIANDRACATHHVGRWVDVGTPERLRGLDEWLAQQGASGAAP